MIEQGLFKRHFVGKDGFHWWIGQISKDEPWMTNFGGNAAEKVDRQGFGFRYQVRIMGYHDDDGALPDSQLPWAHLVYPVTAGSGNSAAAESPQLRRGDFVYGFFIDGEDAQQPVIMGIIGQNSIRDYETIFSDVDLEPFTPVANFNRNMATGSIQSDGAALGTHVTRSQRQPSSDTDEENGDTEDTDGVPADPADPPIEYSQDVQDRFPDTPEGIQAATDFLDPSQNAASVPGLTEHLNELGLTGDRRIVETARYVFALERGETPPSPVETSGPPPLPPIPADPFTGNVNDSSLAFPIDLNLNIGLGTDYTGLVEHNIGYTAFNDLSEADWQAFDFGFRKNPIAKLRDVKVRNQQEKSKQIFKKLFKRFRRLKQDCRIYLILLGILLIIKDSKCLFSPM